MTRFSVLIISALSTLLMGFTAFVLLPYLQVATVEAAVDRIPYTHTQLQGKSLYISEGCVYCHTQQVRPAFYGSDASRAWGTRSSSPGDYIFDKPALLGSQRIGPDLHDAGTRLTDRNAVLAHLYQPRATQANSSMPAYPYLFEVRPKSNVLASETIVQVDPSIAPEGDQVVVATEDALALSDYLMSLKLN